MAGTLAILALGAAGGCVAAKVAEWRAKRGNSSPSFEMLAQLAKGKHEVCSVGLCKVMLMDDTNYPCWVVLVPAKNGLKEVSDLPASEQAVLWSEVQFCANALQELFPCDKMNIATIGNICPQLHIHITCRKQGDVSWPGPCYGAAPAKPYTAEQLKEMMAKLKEALKK